MALRHSADMRIVAEAALNGVSHAVGRNSLRHAHGHAAAPLLEMLSRPVISERPTQRLSHDSLCQGRRYSLGLFAKTGRARSGALGAP
jgi:hypothetical protein